MVVTKPPEMTEDELLTAVLDAARLGGWMAHHDRRSDRAIQQGHSGFPDLCLAKNGRVVFAELKTEKGQLSEAQVRWHLALKGGGAEVYIVRPSDEDRFVKLLLGLS